MSEHREGSVFFKLRIINQLNIPIRAHPKDYNWDIRLLVRKICSDYQIAYQPQTYLID